jgi:hypothetical protein
VTLGELQKRIARIAAATAGLARRFDLFTLVILFALGGHLLLALILDMLAASGVDFASFDPGHTTIPILQIGLFAVQTILIVIAIARSGVRTGVTLAGVAALIWAASMLMLTIVSAQCDLFGACL